MAKLIRVFDWSKTPIGGPERWSPALKTMLQIMLANRFPRILWWEPEYVQFYNDPYRAIPGAKHPKREWLGWWEWKQTNRRVAVFGLN